jgi:GT2 family glycosyltransferase
MSVRADAFRKVAGFQSIDFDDLNLRQRLGHTYGPAALLYVPDAVVHHYVPAQRVQWSYFWRRCFYVNKYKVAAFDNMGQAATLTAEFAFVRRYATRGAYRLGSAVRHREPVESVRAAADTLGIALGGLGNLAGRLQRGRRNQEVAT